MIFLLIGGLWVYFVPLDRDAERDVAPDGAPSSAAIDDHETAFAARGDAEDTRDDPRGRLRAGARGVPHRPRRRRRPPRPASARSSSARDRTRRGHARTSETQDRGRAPAARRPPTGAAGRRRRRASRRPSDAAERNTTLLRLGWVIGTLALAFWLFNMLRRRRSNYFVVGIAAIIAATLQALVMAFDYLGDEIDLDESGPLVIAIAGIVFTLLAFAGLQRYLARRAPRRRVRKGQCPFCAYPVNAHGTHCEGCGRATIAPCATCEAPRRVGTAHCAACGAT